MSSATTQLERAAPPTPPYRVGDFGVSIGEEEEKKYVLTYCPICHLDPEREPHRFDGRIGRAEHFAVEHGPDDVGRPMDELLSSIE